jgi:glycosyltransferase involved in cell wall biosynthesis
MDLDIRQVAQNSENGGGLLDVSAVVPNYNHAQYLPAAVRALASQRPAPSEIIVVDDASTDNSLEVLDALRSEVGTLRIVRHEKNSGAIAALNRGLEEARGALIYFGAADDISQPGLFEHLLGALKEHPEAAFASGEARLIDLSDRDLGVRPPVRPSQRARFFPAPEVAGLLKRCDNWILTGAAVFRRDLVLEAGGFAASARSFADGLLARHLALKNGFVYVPTVLVIWRVNPQGYSRSATSEAKTAEQVVANMMQHICADPVFPRWYPELLERRWRFSVGRIATMESRPIATELLVSFCAQNWVDRLLYRFAAVLGDRVGATVSLAWLFMRQRPMLVRDLLMTMLSRRVGGG